MVMLAKRAGARLVLLQTGQEEMLWLYPDTELLSHLKGQMNECNSSNWCIHVCLDICSLQTRQVSGWLSQSRQHFSQISTFTLLTVLHNFYTRQCLWLLRRRREVWMYVSENVNERAAWLCNRLPLCASWDGVSDTHWPAFLFSGNRQTAKWKT